MKAYGSQFLLPILALILAYDPHGFSSVLKMMILSQLDTSLLSVNQVLHAACSDDIRSKPIYYNTTVPLEWAKIINLNQSTIVNEVESFLNLRKKHVNEYDLIDIDDFDDNLDYLNQDSGYKIIYLKVAGYTTRVANFFPLTMKLITESNAQFTDITINHIHSKQTVPFHRRYFNGHLLYSLTLYAPDENDEILEEYQPTINEPEEHIIGVRPLPSEIPLITPRMIIMTDPDIMKLKSGNRYEETSCYSVKCVLEEGERDEYNLHYTTGDDFIIDPMFEHAHFNDLSKGVWLLNGHYLRDDCPLAVNWFNSFMSNIWLKWGHRRFSKLIKKIDSYRYLSELKEGEKKKKDEDWLEEE